MAQTSEGQPGVVVYVNAAGVRKAINENNRNSVVQARSDGFAPEDQGDRAGDVQYTGTE